MFRIMKMSKYNFTTYDNEGNLIVYNFLTGLPSLTKIMKPDVEKFTQLFLTNDEIHSISCKEHTEAVESLLKSGILVAGDTDESVLYDSKYYEEAYDSRLHLTILPTGECNLSCPYCFEAEKSFSRCAMTVDSQDAMLKFVQRQIPKHRELFVTWFGGEPLLEYQIIKRLSENFIKICNARHLPYAAEIVTNGFFLDADVFDMLYKLKIYQYMVTIDGFKEQHDKLKFTRNGKGTYDIIMNNLLRIRDDKQYKFAKIIIRINMTKSFLNILDDFVCFLGSSFSNDPRFSFLFVAVENFSKSECSNDLYVDGKEMKLRLDKNEVYINKLYLEKDRIVLMYPGETCRAKKKNSYVITPDLKVYKCYTHCDMSINNVGYINLKGDLLLDETFHKRWYLIDKFIQPLPKECNECFYLPACENGYKACPLRYIAPILNEETCPMKKEKLKIELTESVLYAINKYPFFTVVL